MYFQLVGLLDPPAMLGSYVSSLYNGLFWGVRLRSNTLQLPDWLPSAFITARHLARLHVAAALRITTNIHKLHIQAARGLAPLEPPKVLAKRPLLLGRRLGLRFARLALAVDHLAAR